VQDTKWGDMGFSLFDHGELDLIMGDVGIGKCIKKPRACAQICIPRLSNVMCRETGRAQVGMDWMACWSF